MHDFMLETAVLGLIVCLFLALISKRHR